MPALKVPICVGAPLCVPCPASQDLHLWVWARGGHCAIIPELCSLPKLAGRGRPHVCWALSGLAGRMAPPGVLKQRHRREVAPKWGSGGAGLDPWPLTPRPASCLRPGGPPHTVNAFGSLRMSMLAWPGAAWGSQGLGATFPQGVLLLPLRAWPGGTPAGGAGLSG